MVSFPLTLIKSRANWQSLSRIFSGSASDRRNSWLEILNRYLVAHKDAKKQIAGIVANGILNAIMDAFSAHTT
jgi:hypothetical protein